MVVLPRVGMITTIFALAAVSACSTPALSPLQQSTTPAAAAEITQPAGLSSDEVVIWNSLRPESKQAAAEFIADGGTLTQFVSQ